MAKVRVVPCLIHIPCLYPNGVPIEPEKIAKFFDLFDRQFGGSTELGTVPGHWLGIKEPMLRVEVAVNTKEIGQFEKIATQIGKETKQKAMYVMINYRADVRILPGMDEDEGEHSTAVGGGV